MELSEVIFRRRSIRKYDQRSIKKEILQKLIESARVAPSAGNIQPLKYLVITEKEKCNLVFETIKWAKFVQPKRDPREGERPTAYILVLVDKEVSKVFADYYKYDIGAAVENIMLSACDFRIGTCWIGAFNRKFISDKLSIPKKYFLDCLIALGYPAEKPIFEDAKDSCKYYLDNKDTLHVPKRKIQNILFWNKV